MRNRLLLPFLATLAVGAAGDIAAAAESCAARGSQTVDSTRAVRLYVDDGRYRACAYANGRRVKLARGGGTIDDAVIAGRYLAYTVGYDNQVGRNETVFVRNVRTGKWVVRGADPRVAETGIEGVEAAEVVSLRLTARGTAAWGTHYVHGEAARLRAQIVALGGDKAMRLLAAGPAEDATRIDAFSLALVDAPGTPRAYWMQGAEPQTAPVD